MGQAYDIAVIGAGIAGVSSALHLQMRGKKVLLIDRRGAGLETSYGNAGVLQTYHVLPFGTPPLANFPHILMNRDTAARVRYRDLPHFLPWIADFIWQSQPKRRKENGRLLLPLNATSIEEHRVLMRGTDAEKHLTLSGRISIYRSRKSFESAGWELAIARDKGIPFQVMDPEAVSVIEPHLKPNYYKAVNWIGSARLTNPGAVVQAYAEKFTREGGTLLQTEVIKLSSAKEIWTLGTSSGSVEAKQVVLCTGPWANELLGPLGYKFPLGIKRGYHRHYATAPGVKLSHSFVDFDIGYVLAPMEQGLRLVTGMEFADIHAPPDPAQLDMILPFAQELFPLGNALEEKPWCGGRPCFADSRPVIDSAAQNSGLWFNLGHGHSGMTIGPGAGRLLAEMMTGEKPFCDPAPYRAARFIG